MSPDPATKTTTHDDEPFRREGLGMRLLPFAAVAVLAELSIALPPGPHSYDYLALNLVLLGLTAAGAMVPWDRIAPGAAVLVPVLYTASVLMLVLATGSGNSGIGIVVLIPLIWTALYHRRSETFVMVAAVVAVEVITSFTPVRVPDAVIARRVVFWGALGMLISVATHQLRDRSRRSAEEREVLLHQEVELRAQAQALERAAEELTATLNEGALLRDAAKLAAVLVAPTDSVHRRAQYMRIADGMVHIVSQYDEAGEMTLEPFPIADHPLLDGVVRSGEPRHGRLEPADFGPSVRWIVEGLGIRHSAYVPVFVDGVLDGVLAVSLRDQDISDQLFDQCVAVGRLMELALSNARAHERLRAEATIDELTGLANRRGLDHHVHENEVDGDYVVLMIDLDGLKEVNDTLGHAVGDELLAAVAVAMQGAMRGGDVLHRVGGDEFLVIAGESDTANGRVIADRILAALQAVTVAGHRPTASIGIAAGGADRPFTLVQQTADAAMYQAKRAGGGRFVEGAVPVG